MYTLLDKTLPWDFLEKYDLSKDLNLQEAIDYCGLNFTKVPFIFQNAIAYQKIDNFSGAVVLSFPDEMELEFDEETMEQAYLLIDEETDPDHGNMPQAHFWVTRDDSLGIAADKLQTMIAKVQTYPEAELIYSLISNVLIEITQWLPKLGEILVIKTQIEKVRLDEP